MSVSALESDRPVCVGTPESEIALRQFHPEAQHLLRESLIVLTRNHAHRRKHRDDQQ